MPVTRLTNAFEGRFVRPSATDPRRLSAVEQLVWATLDPHFSGIERSPVAPFGTCSAMAGVSQNRVVSTMRGTEVVSDATNVLALEAARRRKQDPSQAVHLAAGHRLLRAQHFGSEQSSAHFRLISLVSSARDEGSGVTEARLTSAHVAAWHGVLTALLPHASVSFDYTIFREGAAAERLRDQVLPTLTTAGIRFRELSHRSGADYYGDLALKVNVADGPSYVELGDGGLTAWTSRLPSDAKQRCFISCLATERLASLIDQH